MSTKTFVINVHDLMEIAVVIKQDEATRQNLKDMLLFWMGGQDRINRFKGDIEKAWCDLFVRRFFMESLSEGHSRAITNFRDGRVEGYFALTEDTGVFLKNAEEFDSDSLDVFTTELED